MKKNKSIIIIIVYIVLFTFTLIGINYISNFNKPQYATYDLDARDSIHYKLGEKTKVNKVKFTLKKVIPLDKEEFLQWELDLEIDNKSYQILHDNYSFKLANNDRLLLKTDCAYKEGKIIVVDTMVEQNRNFNQVVITDNSNYKILATINLNNE
ncbi:MAG: hypothetical protein PHI22_00755 [Bacilli bacterium]|nr:hypothetical protein [Bacilli bacterium]MDD4298189.1 hypothetical protein [Bacilli bacterium]